MEKGKGKGKGLRFVVFWIATVEALGESLALVHSQVVCADGVVVILEEGEGPH